MRGMHGMQIELREGRPDDMASIERLLPRLADFELPARRSPEDLWRGDGELFRAHFDGHREDCIVRVAESQARVVGTSLVSLRKEMLSGDASSHLEALVVAAEVQGKGVGRALLEDARQQAAARGALSMTLHVFASNTRARGLYESAGFDGEILRYIQHFDSPRLAEGSGTHLARVDGDRNGRP